VVLEGGVDLRLFLRASLTASSHSWGMPESGTGTPILLLGALYDLSRHAALYLGPTDWINVVKVRTYEAQRYAKMCHVCKKVRG
jgi:hypothetical protein